MCLKNLFIILLFLTICCVELFSILSDPHVIKANDLSSDITPAIYCKDRLLLSHTLPQWLPFIDAGIPIAIDPLQNCYNPFLLILLLLFTPSLTVKITIFSSIFFAVVITFFLLRFFKISLPLSILVALNYGFGGYIVARIAAGHLEKTLAYPIIPLFFVVFFNFLKSKMMSLSILLGVILTYLFFSGSIYELFYLIIILVVMLVVILFNSVIKHRAKDRKIIFGILVTLISFSLFSAIKLIPVLMEKGLMEHPTTPFQGSQNITTIIYNLFIPYDPLFNFFNLNAQLISPYRWWESYAFIGPLYLIGILLFLPIYRKKIKNKNFALITIIILTTILFASINNFYNPFYWLFNAIPTLQQFRIPSRIFVITSLFLLIISAMQLNIFYTIGSSRVKLLTVLLVLANLILVMLAFRIKLLNSKDIYTNFNSDYSALINTLRAQDISSYYIAQSTLFRNQLPEHLIVKDQQFLLNSNYGFKIKSNLTKSKYNNADFLKNKKYNDILPKYFIYPKKVLPPTSIPFEKIMSGKYADIYENKQFTSLATTVKFDGKDFNTEKNTASGIKKIIFGTNSISILVNNTSKTGKILTVFQNSFPGWKVYLDGKEGKLLKGRFLQTKVEKGVTNYTFVYNLQWFQIGKILTSFSLFICFSYFIYIIYIKINAYILRKYP